MRYAAVLLALLWAVPALAGDLPDPKLTPGVARPELTVKKICATKWGHDARAVTAKMKREVMEAYRFKPSDCPSGKAEIDHLWSRELGGADDVRNLWPQCYEKPVKGRTPSQSPEWGAHKKDRLENELHKQLCAGALTLAEARRELSSDWIASYRKHFGDPAN